MNKEAEEYLNGKNIKPDQIIEVRIWGEDGRIIMSLSKLMQAYADQEVKKAMDSQGFKVCSCGNVITP